jgi:SAM-dependent methyltransferase
LPVILKGREVGLELESREHWRSPDTSEAVHIRSGVAIGAITAEPRAIVDPHCRRLDWITSIKNVSGSLDGEKKKYEKWAREHFERLKDLRPLDPARRDERWWHGPLFTGSAIAATLEDEPSLKSLRGKRILDIGGSFKDSWRFVWFGDAESVEQVEISSASQRLGLARLHIYFEAEPELARRFTCHTAFAEALPFADNSFDLVFSRSTIHHTKRPESLEEIRRVLKVGGVFWILEPREPWLFYWLFRFKRWVTRNDLGTHDPLRTREIRWMSTRFRIEAIHESRFLETFLIGFLGPIRARRLSHWYTPFDEWFTGTRLGKRLAFHVSVVGRKT